MMKTKAHPTFFHGTSGGETRFRFTVIHNDGGSNSNDCSLLAIRDAVPGLLTRSPREIRAELARMFEQMPDEQAFLFANSVTNEQQSRQLGSGAMRVPGHIRARVLEILRGRMLPWAAIELYIQQHHPGTVNVAQWNFSTRDHMFHLAGLAVDMDPSLPTIHIGHWGFTQHFETLVPVHPERVHADIVGRMTARVYRFDGIEFAAAYMPDACMTVIHAKGAKHCAFLSDEHDITQLLHNHRLEYALSSYHFHLRPDTKFYDKGETNSMLDAIEQAAVAQWISTLHMDAAVYDQ